MTIKRITELPEDFADLLDESLNQDFNFLKKMNEEWILGKNRFNKKGESIFAAFDGKKLIGIGGLNIDPYLNNEQVGRVRHLYVFKASRKSGIGRLLMKEIIKNAKLNYSKLRLRTDTHEAAKFYESIGFQRVVDRTASHELVFR